MDRIEEVKQILDDFDPIKDNHHTLACQICQLFEPKPDAIEFKECPECHRLSFVYDPYFKKSRCLRLDCSKQPKPDRLLTQDEMARAIIDNISIPMGQAVAKAQDAKTASIKDAECQARVERTIQLFKENIPCMPDLYGHGCDQDDSDCGNCKHIIDIVDAVRQALKKQEGVD